LLKTILFLTTIFFFHFNLSSSITKYYQNKITPEPNESWVSGEVNLRIENFFETNHPITNHCHQNEMSTDEITIQKKNKNFPETSHRLIYPNQTMFREFIAPSLNSETICSLYKFFHSKNPSISPQ